METAIAENIGVTNNYIEFTGVNGSGVKIYNLQITVDYTAKLGELNQPVDTKTDLLDILGFGVEGIIVPITLFTNRLWKQRKIS